MKAVKRRRVDRPVDEKGDPDKTVVTAVNGNITSFTLAKETTVLGQATHRLAHGLGRRGVWELQGWCFVQADGSMPPRDTETGVAGGAH
jgi:hypothetical protein